MKNPYVGTLIKVSAENVEAIDWTKQLSQTKAPIYQYQVMNRYPHSTDSFTEGLFFSNGHLYEGTGLYKKSTLQEIDLKTGKVLKEHRLLPQYFGEGITEIDNKIYQLTYESNEGFIYDKKDFHLIKTFRNPAQGWGLTSDGEQLILNNGSSSILFVDANDFTLNRFIIVHDGDQTITRVNEMEYIDGKIYANIFGTEIIAIISPEDGKVEGWINLKELNPDPTIFTNDYVLNGIAWNQAKGTLLVTGKCWPFVFEIKVNK
jgi:glutamine cyclotransferase